MHMYKHIIRHTIYRLNNVIIHPRVITIFIGGMITIPSHGCFRDSLIEAADLWCSQDAWWGCVEVEVGWVKCFD